MQGEILIRFAPDTDPLSWQAPVPALRASRSPEPERRCISEKFGVWSLKFDWRIIDERALLAAVRQDPQVGAAQFNHFVELRSRSLPNDPLFSNQWYLQNTGQEEGLVAGFDLGMEEAWDKTTGGVTPQGDTIVICVIDNGLDTDHEDFEDNIWVNRNEIPGNGFDDDGNGYVDDYRGWNVSQGNDQIDDQNWHGTITAGIIGAKGNNGIGVTGINWNVKLMIVVGGFGQAVESRIIEAYDYCLTQRQLYNETDGEKGAFVVASNSSWGVSNSFPDEYPLWCAVYDSLGQAGVINIGATDNKNVDVDAMGDMPTSCESDFLISVTNVGGDGKKVDDAGYGAMSIDLGAYGEQVFMTGEDNTYTEDGGTSFAAPMVTGAVGLLYSANCPTLSAIYRQSPADAALLVKDLILRSVDPEPTLEGLTLTGGRLNINNALNLLLNECGSCPPLLQVGTEALTDVSTRITWLDNELIEQVDFRWRKQGDTDWEELVDVTTPLSFDNLTACTTYEYQFRAFCSEDVIPYEEQSYSFTTDGCCTAPESPRVEFVGFSSVQLSWEPILAAQSYTLRYRPLGAETWSNVFAPTNTRSIQQLDQCTEYEIQVRTNCTGEQTEFGSSIEIRTLGCGACIEAGYCEPDGLGADRSDSEWIGLVELDDFRNESTGEGYSDFTGLTSVSLVRGDTFHLRVEPRFSGFEFDEFFKIWIDYNQDGFFSSVDEVYRSSTVSPSPVDTFLIVPEDAMLGSTRMRIIMKFNGEPSSCISEANNFFGEVEDYCVTVEQVTSTAGHELPGTQLTVFPNPVRDEMVLRLGLNQALPEAELTVFSLDGRPLWRNKMPALAAGEHRFRLSTEAWAAGMYFLRFRTTGGILTRKIVKR